MPDDKQARWQISRAGGILWNIADSESVPDALPHADHVEMSGRQVSVIVRYRIDTRRRLFVERDIFFPQLRVREGDVRGYLRRQYDDKQITFRAFIDGKDWTAHRDGVVERVEFDGVLRFRYALREGVALERAIFPCRTLPAVVENWTVINDSAEPVHICIPYRNISEQEHTQRKGAEIRAWTPASHAFFKNKTDEIAPGTSRVYPILIVVSASDGQENHRTLFPHLEPGTEESERRAFAQRIQTDPAHIGFECPDPELNQLFAFAKLRAAESLFDTEMMGLVHSPGGGNYYCGIWANDQCEYANPFFAFLNDADAHTASVNAYEYYSLHMKPDFEAVPTSFEMGGTIPYRAGGDRGDAAMIASGLARYLLVRGDRDVAEQRYADLIWCNARNHRQTDERGVVLSDTDELEGRFPTGDANLSTSTLAYDGYRMSAHVARELGREEDAAKWTLHADALAIAIEKHFGAEVEGFQTYRYYDGNTTLRAWICLPLVFGLAKGTRQQGTLDALFSPHLWTPDGLATEAGDTVFWDRSTLYGLRGAFIAGATEAAYAHLLAYSRRRLLGDHVPYPVEAYPENAQVHLSAESALYCRVVLEGLLGIAPTGFASFDLAPRLPQAWNEYRVRFTAFGKQDIAIHIERVEAGKLRVRVTAGEQSQFSYDATAPEGDTHSVRRKDSSRIP